MVISHPIFLNQEIPLVSKPIFNSTNSIIIMIITSLGIEAQLLSESDIDRRVNVTFPMKGSNISVRSNVPSTVLSMHKYLNSFYLINIVVTIQSNFLVQ